jgi:hypothetical protein
MCRANALAVRAVGILHPFASLQCRLGAASIIGRRPLVSAIEITPNDGAVKAEGPGSLCTHCSLAAEEANIAGKRHPPRRYTPKGQCRRAPNSQLKVRNQNHHSLFSHTPKRVMTVMGFRPIGRLGCALAEVQVRQPPPATKTRSFRRELRFIRSSYRPRYPPCWARTLSRGVRSNC